MTVHTALPDALTVAAGEALLAGADRVRRAAELIVEAPRAGARDDWTPEPDRAV